MRAEGPWRYSFNELWRLNVDTAQVEHRQAKNVGLWQQVSDYTRAQVMPKAIREAFDLCLTITHQLREQFGVTDTAQSVTDTAQSVTEVVHAVTKAAIVKCIGIK